MVFQRLSLLLVAAAFSTSAVAVQAADRSPTRTSAAYGKTECSTLRVISGGHEKLVDVCYPPVDLRPGGHPSSAGGVTFSSSHYTN